MDKSVDNLWISRFTRTPLPPGDQATRTRPLRASQVPLGPKISSKLGAYGAEVNTKHVYFSPTSRGALGAGKLTPLNQTVKDLCFCFSSFHTLFVYFSHRSRGALGAGIITPGYNVL